MSLPIWDHSLDCAVWLEGAWEWDILDRQDAGYCDCGKDKDKALKPFYTIFLDIDGTLADFVTPASKLHNREGYIPNNHNDHWGLTVEEFWEPINCAGPEFWENLEPYEWAADLYELACDNADLVVISTSPSLQPSCTYGKVKWIRKFFGSQFNDFMIGSKKHLLANSGALLIDDFDAQVKRFIKHGGKGIIFPQPWNVNRELSNAPFAHVCSEIERLRRDSVP